MRDRVFYQDFPKQRTKTALRLNYVGLLYSSFVLIVLFYFVRSLLWIGVLFLAYALLLLVYNGGIALGLRLPMVRLTPRFLIYRGGRIPWQDVADVTILDADGIRRVGIALSDVPLRTTGMHRSVMVRPLLRALIRRDLARYGAIAVPSARGLTLDEFRLAIEDYWGKRAKKGQNSSVDVAEQAVTEDTLEPPGQNGIG